MDRSETTPVWKIALLVCTIIALVTATLLLPEPAEPSQENPACASMRTIADVSQKFKLYIEGLHDHLKLRYMDEPRGTKDEANYLGSYTALRVAMDMYTGEHKQHEGGADLDWSGVEPVIVAALEAHGCIK